MKARAEGETAIGWHVRNFKFVKELLPLSKYLTPPDQARSGRSLRVLELFRRKLARQEETHGAG